MPPDRLFDLLPVAALAVVGILATARVAALRRRGVRVVVVDPQRSAGEKAFDAVVVAVLLFWVYLVVDFAAPPAARWAPAWLMRQRCDLAALKWLGAALLAAGGALYALALAAMGDSWRMGIDRPAHDASAEPGDPGRPPRAALVTAGVFAWSRNPIYLAFDLIFAGAFAIHGRVVFLLTAIALTLLLHLQILREERFLAACYGDQFRDYCRRVGRYGRWS